MKSQKYISIEKMTHNIKTIVTGLILLFTISKAQSQAIFNLENVTAGTGSSFCMEVTAENLQDILSLQFSINWDPTLLEFDEVQNINPNFSSVNINTSGSASGIITYSFIAGPASMPDNDVFFELCFDVIGTLGGSTDVQFTGSPTPIDVLAIVGGFPQTIDLQTQGGTVTFPTPLTISMPDTLINPGASFCIPFSVENFVNLESIQFGINWDPTVMTYNSVTAINLSDLAPASFGIVNAALGQIGFSWFDEDNDPFNGVTVPDGTVIFEMCFTAIGSVNDMTTIMINDNPTSVEVVEFGSTTNIGVTSTGGKVNLQQTIFITNNMITQPNCFDPTGGAINISIAGGTSPYTYLWSNDSTTQDLTGLGIGTYTVTITDSNNPATQFITSFNVAGNFVAPIADAGGLDTISCVEPTTILDGSGSSVGTDIIYEWIHDAGTAIILGADTNMPTVNALGVYELVVTDTLNGCTAMDFAAVTGDVVPPTVDAGEADTLNCSITEIQLNGTVDPAGNYVYAWTTSGTGTIDDETTLTPTIDAAGIYTLLVTEMGTGCSATDVVEIALNDDTPTANAGTVKTINCNNATVTLDGTNSSTGDNISYQWTGTGTITDETTLTPTVNTIGTYTLVVTNDQSQCTDESMVMVNDDFDVPTAVVSDMNDEINCTINSIMLDGTGSSTGNDYTYLWTTINGNIAFDSTLLFPTVDAAGEYILTVTDTTNGCFATDTTTVTQDANIPIANAGPVRTIDCQTLTVQLDGSESSLGAQYKYLWIGTPGSFLTDSTFIAPEVNAGGTYTLQVTDTVNNCVSTSSVTVFLDTIAPQAMPLAPSFISCSQPEIVLLGGVSDLGSGIAFGWTSSTSPFSITPQGDALVSEPGTFCLVQSNILNGCKDTTCVDVFENTIPPVADAGSDFALDCEQTSAMLDGTNSSTGTNFIYNWVALSGTDPTDETTLTPSISSAGEYLVIVTDTINGCMEMDTVMVTQSDDYPIVEAGANGTITCYDPEITLDASLVSSSGPDFMIEWVAGLGSGIVSGDNTLTPIVDEPGPYILTITNINNNCSATDQVLVSSNNTPPIAMVVQDSLEFECDETSLVLDATGTTTTGVQYLWKTVDGLISEGDTTLMPTVASGGHYSFCVTNPNNGCADTTTVFVDALNPAPDVIVDFPMNITCVVTQVTLDATGSTLLPNQIYEWTTNQNGNFVSGQNTMTPIVDAPAVYTFLVTDTITGCMYGAGAIVVNDSTSVMVDAMADGNIDCQTDTINLEAMVTTTSIHVVNAWSTTNGNILTTDTTQLMIQADAGGIYQFIATDTLTGCADTAIVEIINDTNPPTANAGMDTEILCNVTSVFLDGSASSSGIPFVYLWTTTNGNIIGSATEPMLEVDLVGTYILQVTDTTNNCVATDTVETFNSQAVVAFANTPVELDCGMLSIELDGTGSSTGPNVVYLWTGTGAVVDETTLTPEVSTAGTYTLSVMDNVTGCSAMTTVEVTFNNSFPNADAGPDFTSCENIETMAANLPTDATGIWLSLGSAIPTNPSSPTSEITNLQPGENILVWTLSAIGCPEYSSDTVIVTLENAPLAQDDSYVVEENGVLDFNVGSNDSPANGLFQTLTNVVNGTLVDNNTGIYTYTPTPEFFGLEEFEYELCSDACPDVCDIATVSISVTERIPPPIDSLIEQEHNTITPNDDGLNDFFVFDILEEYPNDFVNNEFIVFNRWGSIVYNVKPYNNNWNGTNNNGKPLPEGTYYYILRLDFNAGLIIKGDVTILR